MPRMTGLGLVRLHLWHWMLCLLLAICTIIIQSLWRKRCFRSRQSPFRLWFAFRFSTHHALCQTTRRISLQPSVVLLFYASWLSKLWRACWCFWSFQIRFRIHFKCITTIIVWKLIFSRTTNLLRCLNASGRFYFFWYQSIWRSGLLFCLDLIFRFSFELFTFLENSFLDCIPETLRDCCLCYSARLWCILRLCNLFRLRWLLLHWFRHIIIWNSTRMPSLMYTMLLIVTSARLTLCHCRLTLDTQARGRTALSFGSLWNAWSGVRSNGCWFHGACRSNDSHISTVLRQWLLNIVSSSQEILLNHIWSSTRSVWTSRFVLSSDNVDRYRVYLFCPQLLFPHFC